MSFHCRFGRIGSVLVWFHCGCPVMLAGSCVAIRLSRACPYGLIWLAGITLPGNGVCVCGLIIVTGWLELFTTPAKLPATSAAVGTVNCTTVLVFDGLNSNDVKKKARCLPRRFRGPKGIQIGPPKLKPESIARLKGFWIPCSLFVKEFAPSPSFLWNQYPSPWKSDVPDFSTEAT